MIIGVCGFGSSGSSAVTDYLKEFSSMQVLDNAEFTIPYFQDGIATLDYFLNQAPSKYLSSDVAITRFKTYISFASRTFDKLTDGNFSRLSQKYINDITQASWIGYGATDNVLFTSFTFRLLGSRIMKPRIIPMLEKIFKRNLNIYPIRNIPFSIKPAHFDEITKKYVRDLITAMGAKDRKTVVLNQPFAGNDPGKSFRYFEDPKAIVVDRDPRDMYVFAKEFLWHVGRFIPTDDVETFVRYFRAMREGMTYRSNDKDVLFVQFEALVYDYERTTRQIREFCGIDLADRHREIFVPSRSVNNTQVFRRYKGYEDDIKYIEKELSDYLFDYNAYENIHAIGGMFYGRSELNDGK
jgi:hypothetical protein